MTGESDKQTTVECPNCKRTIKANMHSNRWVKWIDVNCWTCGYHYIMKDIHFDLVQPSSPFFELIYGNKVLKQLNEGKEKHKENKKKFEEGREERLWKRKKEGRLKDSELTEIKSYIKSRGI